MLRIKYGCIDHEVHDRCYAGPLNGLLIYVRKYLVQMMLSMKENLRLVGVLPKNWTKNLIEIGSIRWSIHLVSCIFLAVYLNPSPISSFWKIGINLLLFLLLLS